MHASPGFGPGSSRAPVAFGTPPQQPQSSWGKAALWIALGALILAAAALIVALTRPSGGSPNPAPANDGVPTSNSQAVSDEVDRALCTDIAPLMKESNEAGNTFINLGNTGTSARDEAIPQFRSTTENWARRAQSVLDDHENAHPFFKRTLQRYIDDLSLFVANVRPGPATKYDEAAWSDSLVAYGGPLSICQELGVKW